jgi:phage-related baseplate assembly protein
MDALARAPSSEPPSPAPGAIAAVLLLASTFLRRLNLDVAIPLNEVLVRTGVSRSRAYELRDAVLGALDGLARPPGRPPSPPKAVRDEGPAATISQAVLRFVYANPGCVHAGTKRRHYADVFRRFIVELRAQHPEVELSSFALAIQVPLETLEDWLRAATALRTATDSDASAAPSEPSPRSPETSSPESGFIELILAQWSLWRGSFSEFCDHMRTEWNVPFGRSLIGRILEVHRARSPQRRQGRSPDERALRDTFETFFGGAQWTGDGATIPVSVDGHRLAVNLELNVDTHTGAFVGLTVTATEDEQAVVRAFEKSIETTGAPPIALLLDNKPSNHTTAVDKALGDTLRMRATVERPQNKAHVEGAFGLFRQALPPLEFSTKSHVNLAIDFVNIIATTWARTLNHRPRPDRDGRTRVDLYAEAVTDEAIAAAAAALMERCRKQELARATLLARNNPVVVELVAQALQQFELADPDKHFLASITRYPIAAVSKGIAVFGAKLDKRTLPQDVDARYLLGIVRNVAEEEELIALSQKVLEVNGQVRDLIFKALRTERDVIERDHVDARPRAIAFALRALTAERNIDRQFFEELLGQLLLAVADEERRPLYDHVTRMIATTYRVDARRRQSLILAIGSRLQPIA